MTNQPSEEFIANAHVDAAKYDELYASSVASPDAFWGKEAKRLDWIKPFTKVKNTSFAPGDVSIKWFEDGTLNVSANCIDRHLETRGEQTAIIWEPDNPEDGALHITYRELHLRTCRMANILETLGVRKGERVVLYLPMIPEAAYAMLACARIGAIHSIVFAGFSPDALASRINGSDAKVVITADYAPRGGRQTPLKSNVDAALLHCKDTVKCLVVKRTGGQTTWVDGRDNDYNEMAITANGATTIMFEGVPTYPDASRFWQVVDKHKVNQFYTAPTALRALMAKGNEFAEKCDLATLKVLGTVGEPINPEAWNWYNDVIGKGRCPIVDTWWQTETGGHMMTPLPGAHPTKPGAAMKPFFGVQPVVLDPQSGEEIAGFPCEGVLCIKDSWPGQMRTIWGDHERFEKTYFSDYKGYYFAGDGCKRDKDGDYWITGRVDDVINVSGHRMGTAEVESALVAHIDVAEAAVVGNPHEIKGQGIYCFVTLMNGVEPTEELRTQLRSWVRKEIGLLPPPT